MPPLLASNFKIKPGSIFATATTRLPARCSTALRPVEQKAISETASSALGSRIAAAHESNQALDAGSASPRRRPHSPLLDPLVPVAA